MADKRKQRKKSKHAAWDEFECPECDAHNPSGDDFHIGDEVFCNWCGNAFVVKKGPNEETFVLKAN